MNKLVTSFFVLALISLFIGNVACEARGGFGGRGFGGFGRSGSGGIGNIGRSQGFRSGGMGNIGGSNFSSNRGEFGRRDFGYNRFDRREFRRRDRFDRQYQGQNNWNANGQSPGINNYRWRNGQNNGWGNRGENPYSYNQSAYGQSYPWRNGVNGQTMPAGYSGIPMGTMPGAVSSGGLNPANFSPMTAGVMQQFHNFRNNMEGTRTN